MQNTEDVVIQIVKSVVFKLYKEKVTLSSELREDLGIDSIKMIAIAAELKEEGYDVISHISDSGNSYAAVETVQDIVDFIKEIQ
ncbi:acyl carrier protein [Paenibacillus plantarum]|nr:acyl carrier protein [Paenibacillus plantarum]